MPVHPLVRVLRRTLLLAAGLELGAPFAVAFAFPLGVLAGVEPFNVPNVMCDSSPFFSSFAGEVRRLALALPLAPLLGGLDADFGGGSGVGSFSTSGSLS